MKTVVAPIAPLPIASLPMYDWPEMSGRHDMLWHALSRHLRAHGIPAPDDLFRTTGEEKCRDDPALLIGQTCGYPYWTKLRGQVAVLGAPHYAVEGCDGPNYASAILTRADAKWVTLSDCHGASVAVNEAGSLSGHLAMRATLGGVAGGVPVVGPVRHSGSHRQSMQMVAFGQADLCAIDAVCWDMAQQVMPDIADRLRVLTWSPAMPGLPWITAMRADEELEKLQLTLKSFFSESTYESVYKPLRISGFSVLGDRDYAPVGQLADGRSHVLADPLLC